MPADRKRALDERDEVTVSEPKRVKGGSMCSPSGCVGYVGHNLYLGSEISRVPELLTEQGITHVLMFGRNKDREKWEGDRLKGFEFRFVEMGDKNHAGTSRENEVREKYLAECAGFITEGTTGTNRTLVHCQRGRARSATIVAMHLVHAHQYTVMEAVLLLFTARYDLLPQDSPITALRTFEQERIKDTNKEESFIDTNLPGEACRAGIVKRNPASFLEAIEKNKGFVMTHKSKIAHLRGRVGLPLSSGPGSLYAEHRFKAYLSWDEIHVVGESS